MAYKIEFDRDGATTWRLTDDGADRVRDDSYTPTIYAGGPTDALDELASSLASDPKVTGLDREAWYPSLHADDRERVLRIDVERMREVATLAREIRRLREPNANLPPGTLRLYNVDFARQFRYCLETNTCPIPTRRPRTVELELPETALADDDVTPLQVDGQSLGDTPRKALEALQAYLEQTDPDVLVVDRSPLVPFLVDTAADLGIDGFRLGREPGYDQLAGSNQYASYGRVGHSPARYDVPGRVLISRNNSFLWSEGKLAGLLELVEWSWRPLQETGWASIGTSFTAMQTREAYDRGVLVPWSKWEPEQYKRAETLHEADRGGFTFAPEVGLHDSVTEIDFSSMYPNIMVEYNISPETVQCDCHGDREDVPGLEYAICDDPGFLGDVLAPLIDARDTINEKLAADPSDPEARRLEHRSEALKWVLVTCFGYQGYSNAKFGRIECHEAINAYARELLLDAKNRLEAHGWRVVHGIVDSLWVQPADQAEDPTPIDEVTTEISEAAAIRLEHEADYDWVCFVPRRDSTQAGALTKYFGRVAGSDEFKYRGIELRQRSTCRFVAEVQKALIEVLDETREPAPVVDRLDHALQRLRAGVVPPDQLCIEKRASKAREGYTQSTHTAAALERYADLGVERHPGQHVEYVVVDDDARRETERVRLAVEDVQAYDADYYEDLLVRACESVVSPLGWDRTDIRAAMRDRRDASLSAFGNTTGPSDTR